MSAPDTQAATLVSVEGIHTFYGKSHILHGVSLEVREGEIVTLLGRNGGSHSHGALQLQMRDQTA